MEVGPTRQHQGWMHNFTENPPRYSSDRIFVLDDDLTRRNVLENRKQGHGPGWQLFCKTSGKTSPR